MPLTPKPSCRRPAAVCAARPVAPEALRTSTTTELAAGSGAVVDVVGAVVDVVVEDVVEAVVEVALIAWVVDPWCADDEAESELVEFRDGKITTASTTAAMTTTPIAARAISQRLSFIPRERR